MKIIPKLTLALVGGMCFVLGLNGFVRVRRETESFDRERVARHRRAATAMSAAMGAAWKRQGREAAIETMDGIATGFPSMRVRWMPREEGERPRNAPLVAPATRVDDTTTDEATRITNVTVTVDGEAVGDVELTEPMTADRLNAQLVLWETLKTAALLASLAAVIAFALSQWVVGKPVRALAEKARRIGRGDFGDPLRLDAADELTELAREMNAMSERLVGTLEQLRHADRLATLGKLAAGVAHELGTPMNVVSARAEMIMSGRTSADQSREYAGVIADAVSRMTETISQLLHFARRKTLARAPHDVTALVAETVALLAPLAKKRDVSIAIEGASVTASVDAAQLQQVVTNLVMNAAQASPAGGTVTVRITQRTETPPADVGGDEIDAVAIAVEDRGTGISPEDLPRVFEPFFTTKDVGEGTGLGLAVSYGIVREHRGWMNVRSKVGEGSTFTAFLPLGDRAE